MITFLLKRLLWMVLTLWAVFTATFVLMRLVPGGPFKGEKNLPPAIERNVVAHYNLDDPPLTQYFRQLSNYCRFDFGPSYRLEDYTVNEVIAEGFPISATLGIFALLFAIALGVTSGVVSAIRRKSWFDFVCMATAVLGISVPSFVLASGAVIIFCFSLNIFPVAGWGTLWHIVLPAVCLGAPYAGYIARLTRTSMLEVLGQDYIRTAYAKGLLPTRVILRHALRSALTPIVSYLGPATAYVVTGSLVVERIFNLPGLGSHFVEAALQRDYTLAMGMVLIFTTFLYVLNTVVDLAYTILDPRIKLE